jgi:hypothetical protein
LEEEEGVLHRTGTFLYTRLFGTSFEDDDDSPNERAEGTKKVVIGKRREKDDYYLIWRLFLVSQNLELRT